jgi:hypothetical protein
MSLRQKEGSIKNFKIKSNWGVGVVKISFLLSFLRSVLKNKHNKVLLVNSNKSQSYPSALYSFSFGMIHLVIGLFQDAAKRSQQNKTKVVRLSKKGEKQLLTKITTK